MPSRASIGESSRPCITSIPRDGGWRYTFNCLGNRDYLRLWVGIVAMIAGNQMQVIAQSYLVSYLTGSA